MLNTTTLLCGGALTAGVVLVYVIHRHHQGVLSARKKVLTDLSSGKAEEKSNQPPSPTPPPPVEGSDMQELSNTLKKYEGYFSTLAKSLREQQKTASEYFEKAADTAARQDGMLHGIRDYLAMKNDITARLQEGYDYLILKKFVKQIIRCIHQLDTNQQDETEMDPFKKMEIVRCNLLDILDRNGIEKLVPEEGTPFADIRKTAEVIPQKEPTSDENLVGKVAAVIRPGYRYTIQHDKHRIIMPAQVKVYELVRSK